MQDLTPSTFEPEETVREVSGFIVRSWCVGDTVTFTVEPGPDAENWTVLRIPFSAFAAKPGEERQCLAPSQH